MLDKWLAPLWAVVILVGCTMPTDNISIDSNVLFPHIDKVVHFVLYLVFQWLLLRHNQIHGNGFSQLVIFILCICYGFLIECIQGFFLEARFFENYDIIANITGALAGMTFFNLKKS